MVQSQASQASQAVNGVALPKNIPSLNGLRAISIGLVLLGHLTGTANFPQWISPLSRLAALGVQEFFVISGFLITTLLLRELREHGTISLWGFYFRRVLRIFPASYTFILTVSVLCYFDVVQLLPGDIIHAVTYTMNYHQPHGWNLGHLWSLAVEEQFYLLWPAAVLWMGSAGAQRVALACVAIVPVTRFLTWTFVPEMRPNYGQQFEAVADMLATGCLLAVGYERLGEWKRYQDFLASSRFWLAPATAVALAFVERPRFMFLVGQPIVNTCLAITVERMVRYPGFASGRILNQKWMVQIGILSYSLYLWQQLFLNRASSAWPTAFPVNLALAAASATLSYYVVERPMLRIKDRLGSEPWSRMFRRRSSRAV